MGLRTADPRADGIGWRVIASKDSTENWVEDGSWLGMRIGAGVSEIGSDFAADSYFPHDLAMDFAWWHRLRKRLLCRPGSRVANETPRNRAPASGSGRRRTRSSRVPRSWQNSRDAGSIGAVADGRAIGILRAGPADRDRRCDLSGRACQACPARLGRLPFWGFGRGVIARFLTFFGGAHGAPAPPRLAAHAVGPPS